MEYMKEQVDASVGLAEKIARLEVALALVKSVNPEDPRVARIQQELDSDIASTGVDDPLAEMLLSQAREKIRIETARRDALDSMCIGELFEMVYDLASRDKRTRCKVRVRDPFSGPSGGEMELLWSRFVTAIGDGKNVHPKTLLKVLSDMLFVAREEIVFTKLPPTVERWYDLPKGSKISK